MTVRARIIQIVGLLMFAMLAVWNVIDTPGMGIRWVFVALAVWFGAAGAYEVWKLRANR